MGWFHVRASDIGDQADPLAADQLRSWSSDTKALELALALLARGSTYAYGVIGDGTCYVLLAGSVPSLASRPAAICGAVCPLMRAGPES